MSSHSVPVIVSSQVFSRNVFTISLRSRPFGERVSSPPRPLHIPNRLKFIASLRHVGNKMSVYASHEGRWI